MSGYAECAVLLPCFSVPFPGLLMACLDMYNNSPPPPHPQPPTPMTMSPRISFSNDFAESHNNSHHSLLNSWSREAPASTDFEFSVTNYNMMSADELFSKGRLLPFKDNNNGSSSNTQMQRTLRDELLVDEDDNGGIGFSLKPPKASSSSSSNRWKGFLGLRKSHIGSKKPEKTFAFSPQDAHLTKSPQDMVSSEGPSSTDMEMGI